MGADHKFFLKILFWVTILAFIMAYLSPYLEKTGFWDVIDIQ